MALPIVALKKTAPKTIFKDYFDLFDKAQLLNTLDKSVPVVLKLNLSWTRMYPACSTPPWQFEAVVRYLLESGWHEKDIIPIEHRTVVTNVEKGALNNKWMSVVDRYKLKFHFLTEAKWRRFEPKQYKPLIIHKIFPDQGVLLPEVIFGKNIIHFPTVKMHVFTTITGAIKNAYGLLTEKRHYGHRFIHQMVVDLLGIQKEITAGYFAVMDGTTVGKGSGPRAMDWQVKNVILASADAVALDATSAYLMGFNPASRRLKFIALAAQKGLGEYQKDKIKYLGDTNLLNRPWNFTPADTFASSGQKLIYHHTPLWLEKLLLQTIIAPWSYFASWLYHDIYWWYAKGARRQRRWLETTPWGQLFSSY
ncbi:MAG: DUF362 domain-containing protein [bacterium]|nr:DUF362 domain-containing protein [bacterium]